MKKSAAAGPIVWALAFVMLAGCSTIGPFNQRAYELATSLKVDALTTMGKAAEPFDNHRQEVAALKMNLEKAYEYARGRVKNEASTGQWAIIMDPSRNSLGGFLKRWEDETTLDAGFIEEAKRLVSDGFDAVIALESGKRKMSGGQTP